MKQITDERDKRFFKTLVSFVQAGGNIENFVQMVTFCKKYEVNISEFTKVMQLEESNSMVEKLKRCGLI